MRFGCSAKTRNTNCAIKKYINLSCCLPKEVDVSSQDKESGFKLKTFGRDSMNEFWQQAFNETSGCFNNLADADLEVSHIGIHRSKQVLFFVAGSVPDRLRTSHL